QARCAIPAELTSDRDLRKKLPYGQGDLLDVRLQREVAGVEQLEDRLRVIALEGLGARGYEIRIVLSPDRKQRRLPFPEILLAGWVELHVVSVVKEQVQLNVDVAGPCH